MSGLVGAISAQVPRGTYTQVLTSNINFSVGASGSTPGQVTVGPVKVSDFREKTIFVHSTGSVGLNWTASGSHDNVSWFGTFPNGNYKTGSVTSNLQSTTFTDSISYIGLTVFNYNNFAVSGSAFISVVVIP